MRFSKVRIRNYGILADIDFSPRKGIADVIFLNGRNGRGKTSFQSAIRWCIYGADNPSHWLSRWAINEHKEGAQIEMSVELGVELDGHGTNASIKRTQVFEKTKDAAVRRVGQENVVVRVINPDGMTDVLAQPETWLRKYFPKRFMNFFLFDGELMKNFFDTRVKGAIENAVREIAGVDYFEEVQSKLQLAHNTIDKAIAKMSGGDAERLRRELEDARKLAFRVRDEVSKDLQELSDLEEELKEKQATWAAIKDAAADAERDQEIRVLLDEKHKTLGALENDLTRQTQNAGSAALLAGAIGIVESEIRKAHEMGTLPPPFNPASLQHLLDRGSCICGTDLDSETAASQEINQLILNFEKASVVGKRLDLTGRRIEILAERTKSEFETIRAINSQIVETRQDIERLRNEQEALATGLEKSDNVTIAGLGKRIEELNRLIPDKRVQIADAQRDLHEHLEPAEKKAQARFDEVSAKEGEVKQLQAQAVLAGELAQAAGAIHSVAIQLVRERLEQSISEKFSVVKEGTFVTKVTEDFDVLTLEQDGSETTLSEGEKMMKAYIFSFALREVVGLAFPLVVDTPFGRLDEFFREEVAKMLADLVAQNTGGNERQVIFLMHDGEYTPYTKKHFAATDPHEAYLAWVETDRKSALGEGIDPDWFTRTAWKDWKAGKIK